jgi:hypothetical protein
MVHMVVMKYFTSLPLLTHIELLWVVVGVLRIEESESESEVLSTDSTALLTCDS